MSLQLIGYGATLLVLFVFVLMTRGPFQTGAITVLLVAAFPFAVWLLLILLYAKAWLVP
jgi:hypothetical protein